MRSSSDPSTQEVLAGLVERVTFHNAENGFCVLRAKARGHRDLVTVVGHAAMISAGEWITASGEWINDRAHGQQFKARFLKTSAPSSIDGIEKYLGSGMIRGVGPVYGLRRGRTPGPTGGAFADRWATQHRLRLVAHRQRRRPRLCGEKSPLLTIAGAGRSPTASRMGRGLQRALNVSPWRDNALMVDMTTKALFILLSARRPTSAHQPKPDLPRTSSTAEVRP
jgi:hypothetical protein